jgi:hypothetical protein
VWGDIKIYASAMSHSPQSTVYKYSEATGWEEMPYGIISGRVVAPIRSMASFAGRLFAGEGNNPVGASLYYTLSGAAWIEDGIFALYPTFQGEDGEIPLAFHALTPASVGTRHYLYVAVQYVGAGVRIWRRTLDVWDLFLDSLYRAMRIGVPFQPRWPIPWR